MSSSGAPSSGLPADRQSEAMQSREATDRGCLLARAGVESGGSGALLLGQLWFSQLWFNEVDIGGEPLSRPNDFNRRNIEEVRATGGKESGPFTGRPILLLTTTGAKSGNHQPRRSCI